MVIAWGRGFTQVKSGELFVWLQVATTRGIFVGFCGTPGPTALVEKGNVVAVVQSHPQAFNLLGITKRRISATTFVG
jgi:hypothetical protein